MEKLIWELLEVELAIKRLVDILHAIRPYGEDFSPKEKELLLMCGDLSRALANHRNFIQLEQEEE